MIMGWDLAVTKHSRLRERETEALNLLACFPRTFVPWLRARERERERERERVETLEMSISRISMYSYRGCTI